MIKKESDNSLQVICTILVLPIGPVCEVFAKEEKQENSVSTESISQSLNYGIRHRQISIHRKLMVESGCNSHYLWEMEIWVI